jgi:hypothetical protein
MKEQGKREEGTKCILDRSYQSMKTTLLHFYLVFYNFIFLLWDFMMWDPHYETRFIINPIQKNWKTNMHNLC